jgi:dipeptidyl aminopeptidase/acylaminoacyl peptidase
MPSRITRRAWLCLPICLMLASCEPTSVSPTGALPPETATPEQPDEVEPEPAPDFEFPPVPETSVAYESLNATRYILHDNDEFALQIASSRGLHEYVGTVTIDGPLLLFSFTGLSTAEGVIAGDQLTVRYDADMLMSDFVDETFYRVSTERRQLAQIHIAATDGSRQRLLASGNGPSWSPDGDRIAFTGHHGWVHVIGVDGSDETAVVQGHSPSWSPDGRRIVYVDEEGIKVVGADGSAPMLLLRHDHFQWTGARLSAPNWSPAGNRIAFVVQGEIGDIFLPRIYIADFNGSEPQPLTSLSGTWWDEESPEWSPDGTRVLFWSRGHGIAVSHAIGSRPVTLYSNFPAVGSLSGPTWSPDGSRVLFTAEIGRSSYELWTVPAGGGAASLLLRDARGATWSPDGSSFAFVRVVSPGASAE